MATQNETSNTYEFQSFDSFPKAPMFPTGWDLSEMQSEPKTDSAVEESDQPEPN